MFCAIKFRGETTKGPPDFWISWVALDDSHAILSFIEISSLLTRISLTMLVM